jgi:hypothetical protein
MQQMSTSASDSSPCFDRFGHWDFAPDRSHIRYTQCPLAGCVTTFDGARNRDAPKPFCPIHGLRLHSDTFVYWNGPQHQLEAKLRNFPIRADLAREVAMGSVAKAESHRLGYEMSEDALTWNVLVGLADAGKLRDALRFLTGREVRKEPDLYLWGELVDVSGSRRGRFRPLDTTRARLESDIARFKTEPDAMLVTEEELVVCIEAKFGSGNPVAHESVVAPGSKPTDRTRLISRYWEGAGIATKTAINVDFVGPSLHSQLFRNVVFASEMANGCDWHVVNLVSQTQWRLRRNSVQHSYENPTGQVSEYLSPAHRGCFTFRTWEALHATLIRNEPALGALDEYMRSRSAHYQRAFDLGCDAPPCVP